MSNVSALFENLMTYNESNATKKTDVKKVVKESDTTLLNLTVELPAEKEEIAPEDVKVNVGVMNVEQDDVPEGAEVPENPDVEDDEIIIDEPKDVTPDTEEPVDNDDDDTKKKDDSKEEALRLRKEAIRQKRLEAKALREAKNDDENKECTGKEDCTCESCKAKVEKVDVETAKANIRERVANAKPAEECLEKTVKKESLMHLDTKSLNKLFTEFVKENYKNIDKVVITKAMLENRMLKVEGIITNVDGESANISLTNRGFNPAKLENKRFIMDFKDTSGTFGVVKESLKQPFVFTCALKEGVLTFEELKYSYKTMVESKTCEVSGKCTLTESVEVKNENADQVKKFNEIVEKIKAAKTANDLIACKDEMDESNIGDTLLSAAQMVWDDVNSRMRAQ